MDYISYFSSSTLCLSEPTWCRRWLTFSPWLGWLVLEHMLSHFRTGFLLISIEIWVSALTMHCYQSLIATIYPTCRIISGRKSNNQCLSRPFFIQKQTQLFTFDQRDGRASIPSMFSLITVYETACNWSRAAVYKIHWPCNNLSPLISRHQAR